MASNNFVAENVCASLPGACVFGHCVQSNGSAGLSVSCVCRNMFGDNLMFVRINDCSVPALLFPVTMAIVVAIGSFGTVFAAYQTQKSKGRTKTLLELQAVGALSLTATGIDALIEGICGRPFFAFLFVFHTSMFVSYGMLLDMFIQTTALSIMSTSILFTDKVIRFLRIALMTLGPMPTASLALLSFALGSERSPSYNILLWNAGVAWAWSSLAVVILLFGVPITLRSSRIMLEAINSSRPIALHSSPAIDASLMDVRRRIMIFRLWGGIIMPVSLTLSLVLCFGVAYLYHWVALGYFAALAMLFGTIAPIFLTLVLTPRVLKPDSPRIQAASEEAYPAHQWGMRRDFSLQSSKANTTEGKAITQTEQSSYFG